ncbi:BNR-4 repeat-containing protein [Alteromonas sp.]|uniref:BNR-4 repeat-containing protein n=1 Tax=Alteromonas sp. TaxID=232 RepID=UPI00257D791A|nr:BNR-4 repeat-containing protein [Alteromonas sp.]|tara:strand:- start:18446 stop:19969 length:1524 start_codon:yes stop_codon:yes gene_type:complete
MKNKWLMLLFVVQLFGCAFFTNGKEPSTPQDNYASLPSLSLHSTPILLGSSLLVGKSHTSDGSDRAVDGKPRFSGVMGAQAVTYKGYQYVIYYTAKDRGGYGDLFAEVVVARRKVTGHDWQYATLPVYRLTSDDAHNRQAIEISKGDGAIHISFDHHNSDRINYARTAAGVADHPETVDWNDDIFKFKRNLGFSNDAVSRVTYPKFYSLDSGNVLMYFREGGAAKGEMRLALYDAKNSDWQFIRNLSSNDGVYLQNVNGNKKPSTRGPYLAGGGPKFDANGRMHISWVFREKPINCNPGTSNGSDRNHGIYYAYSDDEGLTWYNNASNLVADTREGEVLSVETPGLEAVHVPTTLRPSNVSHNSVIDTKTGDYHLLLSHKTSLDGPARVHHYVRDISGKWQKRVSDFNASNVTLTFLDDRLFAFAGRGDARIFYSDRTDGFTEWHKIEMPNVDNELVTIEGGYITWDLSLLSHGVASIVWQHAPKINGEPSPIYVYDFELGKIEPSE